MLMSFETAHIFIEFLNSSQLYNFLWSQISSSTPPDNIYFGFSFYFKDGRTWEDIVEPPKTSHPINLKVHYRENYLHFVI